MLLTPEEWNDLPWLDKILVWIFKGRPTPRQIVLPPPSPFSRGDIQNELPHLPAAKREYGSPKNF